MPETWHRIFRARPTEAQMSIRRQGGLFVEQIYRWRPRDSAGSQRLQRGGVVFIAQLRRTHEIGVGQFLQFGNRGLQ